jgi:hypothetical protein
MAARMTLTGVFARQLTHLPIARRVMVMASLLWVLPMPAPLWAGTMTQDPRGFHNITWGTVLAERPELVLMDKGEQITGYDFKNGPPPLGEAQVDSIRLSAIEGKFARAAVHYRGKQNHERILAYLEAQFGPIDRAPGSMMRGLNQQYNWRGMETEINLIYQSFGERGVVFFESRVLAPRFNDTLSETAY